MNRKQNGGMSCYDYGMDTPLIATKWYSPPPRPNAIGRSRLLARLNAGVGGKLTLISAAAGFGKTTLISAWLATDERRTAWVSLDEGDNDITRFLTYVIAALQTIAPKFGAVIANALQTAQPVAILQSLWVNEMAAISTPFTLVLDDYHLIDNSAIDAFLGFIIDYLPPHGHVVIATREDPQLPLARWRVRNQLTELRAADLRFTPDETAEFLMQVMGLSLSVGDVERLGARTEGWVAGLQLAAIALQTQSPSESARFIHAFTGSHRFVLDYLAEEVLNHQPQAIQQFLLHTAILDRFCGALCEAVSLDTAGAGQHTLTALEQANLFLIPLDDERRWYRYHHLFAEVLRTRLEKLEPALIPELHRRASLWYEGNHLLPEAIRHALIAADFERAAALVERIWPSIRRRRQEAVFFHWIQAIPEQIFALRPVLCVVYAWALLDSGEYDAAEARLQQAERLLSAPHEAFIISDEAQFRSLPATIANARAYRAQAVNDVAATITYARLALELLPLDDDYERGTTAALLGLAYWSSGALDAAYQSFYDGLILLQRGGGVLIRMGGTVILAHINIAQGRLYQAANLYQQALAVGMSHSQTPLHGTAELYLGLSEISREQGDLAAAWRYFVTGTNLRETASLPGYDYLWHSVEARLKQSEGDWEAALESLKHAERLYYRSPIPDVRPIAALRARFLTAVNRLPEAQAWARETGLSADDDLSYLREYEHLTYARVLIALYRRDKAEHLIEDVTRLLARLLTLAEGQGRTGSITEILMLQALAHHAHGQNKTALMCLTQALALAEPDSRVRLFVDEGQPIIPLLKQLVSGQNRADYAQRLLGVLGEESPQRVISPSRALIDPLSDRELEVLRLFKTELSGPDIARELSVALSTIRTHTKRIYDKLGVSNRRAAVNRAEALGLI